MSASDYSNKVNNVSDSMLAAKIIRDLIAGKTLEYKPIDDMVIYKSINVYNKETDYTYREKVVVYSFIKPIQKDMHKF